MPDYRRPSEDRREAWEHLGDAATVLAAARNKTRDAADTPNGDAPSHVLLEGIRNAQAHLGHAQHYLRRYTGAQTPDRAAVMNGRRVQGIARGAQRDLIQATHALSAPDPADDPQALISDAMESISLAHEDRLFKPDRDALRPENQ